MIKKKWQRMVFLVTTIIIFIVIYGHATKKKTVVSWFVADVTGDTQEELLMITHNRFIKKTIPETDEAYGDFIYIYDSFDIINQKPVWHGEPLYFFDLSAIKPHTIAAGDVDGDGKKDISICVYKTATFHPVPAKRPFFYALSEGELQPLWLGSRLARPFVDYVLCDMGADGVDNIVSLERLEDEKTAVVVYQWKGFGFEVIAMTEPLIGTHSFVRSNRAYESVEIIQVTENIRYTLQVKGEIVELVNSE